MCQNRKFHSIPSNYTQNLDIPETFDLWYVYGYGMEKFTDSAIRLEVETKLRTPLKLLLLGFNKLYYRIYSPDTVLEMTNDTKKKGGG